MPLSRAGKLRHAASGVQISAADSRVSVTANLDTAVLCHTSAMNAFSWLLLYHLRGCQPVEETLYEFLQCCRAFGRNKMWGMVTSFAEL